MLKQSVDDYTNRIIILNQLVDKYLLETDFTIKKSIINSFNTNIQSLYYDYYETSFFQENSIFMNCLTNKIIFFISNLSNKNQSIKRKMSINDNLLWSPKNELIFLEHIFSIVKAEESTTISENSKLAIEVFKEYYYKK